MIRFPIEDARQQYSCRSHNGTSRLKQQMKFQTAQRSEHRPSISRNLLFETTLQSLVGDSQTTAGIEIANVVSLRAQFADEVSHTFQRRSK